MLLVGYDFLSRSVGTGLTAEQQNMAQIERARKKLELARIDPRFDFKLNLGLMHAAFGIAGQFEPGELPYPGGPPDYDPLPGGDPSRLSDPSTFRDGVHLTSEGYVALAAHCIEQFYNDWLLHPLSGPVAPTP